MAVNTIRNSIKLCTWNCNGIRQKTSELQDLAREQNLDVILLQETKLNPTVSLKMMNYVVYRTDRLTHQGGGSAILIKGEIPHCEVDIPNVPAGMEATAVRIRCFPVGYIYVISAYNPPQNGIDANAFINLFHPSAPTILGGDLNSKNVIWHSRSNNRNGEILEQISDDHSIYVDAPTENTYEPIDLRRQGDVLDVFCFKNFSNFYTLKVHKKLDSDHWPVELTLYNFPMSVIRKNPKYTDWEVYAQTLESCTSNHTHLYTNQGQIDNAVEEITSNINRAIDTATRIKDNVQNPFELPNYIKKLINRRNRARKDYKRTYSNNSKLIYNHLRNRVKSEIMTYRNNKWSEFVENLSLEDSSLWQMSRKLLKKNKPMPALIHSGTKIYDDQGKADVLASMYESQFQTTREHLTERHTNITEHVGRHLRTHMQKEPRNDAPKCATREVIHVINGLKNRKAPGRDNISNEAIKHLPTGILKDLTRIINSCLRISYFPTKWKSAIIKPIHKAGKATNLPASYRPISLLPTMSKILERVIQRHLAKHLEDGNVLQKEQFGFRDRHSTTHQLMRVIEHTLNGFEVGGKTAILFLDVKKAFDQIWTNGLLMKCITIKLPEWLFFMISSFLHNRRFQVQVNNSLSGIKQIRAGVRQGSVLGPMLFNLYMSDLKIEKPARLALYADDAALILSDINEHRITSRLQKYIPQVEHWYRFWRLEINTEKTKAMFISKTGKAPPNRKLQMYGNEIEWVNEYPYLGVTLDKGLTFKKHVENKLKTAKAATAQLHPLISRNSKLSPKNKLIIYTQIILPALLYASTCWCTIADSLYKKLSSFQNQYVKRALNIPWFVRGAIVQKEIGLPSIRERIYNYALNYYENLESHPNELILETVKYPLGKERKRIRPRDYLLKKPP